MSPVVGVVALLLLLDAAAETLWSGSPIRWWVALGVVAAVAPSAWLWRRRPAAAATLSVCALLALLALTVWLPAGQSDGIRMLAQTTPTVLAAVLLLAAVLAALMLAQAAASLPGTARAAVTAVVAILAAYSAVALCLGIRDHVPYAALLHGGSLWQRLPAWLQGAFIGALVLVPLAVLAGLARIVVAYGRRQPVGILVRQTIALVLAFVMAVSGVAVPRSSLVAPSQGSTGSASGGPELASAYASFGQSKDAVANLLTGSSNDAAVTTEVAATRIDTMLRTLGTAADRVPRDTFDVGAVVERVGRDPVKLFEWVRDHTVWVPYRGVLRNATGVLLDRQGNSLDRSLLLAALLKAAGHTARLAHAQLPPEQARTVAATARVPKRESPMPEAESDALLSGVARDLQADETALRAAVARLVAASRDVASEAQRRVDRQAALLADAVGRQAAAGKSGETAAADHWWIQVESGGAWSDLDATWPGAKPGTAAVAPAATLDPKGLPADLYHRVVVRVVIEQAANGRLKERVALNETLRPSEVLGKPIVLRHVASTWKPGVDVATAADGPTRLANGAREEKKWIPVLAVGSAFLADKAFTTTGELTDAEPAISGAATVTRDIIGFLGGGEGTEEESGQLTAEWIEYRTVVPGESDRVARREVFDLLGPAARSAGTVPTAALTDRQRLDRALAFLGDTRILPLASWLSPQYVRWLNARAALDNRESLLTLSRSDPERDAAAISRVFSKLTPAPGPLYELALARHEWSADGDDVFLAEANVLTYRNTVRAGADGAVEGVEGFDIVASNVAVRPSATRDAMEARIRQGALDANAEALLARACCGGSIQATAEAFASADRAGTSWVTLRTKDAAARAQWPEDVRARIAADLDAGYVVVAPAALSAGTVSWWRIDPRTGNTLAMARTGWGGALAEAAVQNLRILLQIEAFVVCGIKIQTARDWSAAKKAALLVACSAVAYFGIGNVAMGSTALTKALWLSVAKDLTGLIAVNGVTMFM